MKKLESGRSMVEMLGVLAIIGVLSVGGIAGYSLGMRKHRVNQIADTVSKYAVVAYNQCQQKLLNGEIDGSAQFGTMITGCNSIISFEEASVGTKPAGVKEIVRASVTQNDEVYVSVVFDDDTLCKAYSSVVGTECNTDVDNPTVGQTIKQN